MNVGIYVCVNEVIILEAIKNHINGIQVLRKEGFKVGNMVMEIVILYIDDARLTALTQ